MWSNKLLASQVIIAHTGSQEDDWAMRSTSQNMSLTKCLMRFKGGPDIPKDWIM